MSAERLPPQVSVLMAVYNGVDYLDQAVESILGQTWRDFEFIVVDDASTDDTPQMLAQYEDPRIVRLRNDANLGLARSLNRGLSRARGRYIARQDADDASLPDRLAKQVAFLNSHPRAGLVGATASWIDDAGNELRVWRTPTDNDRLQEDLLRYCPIIHGSVLLRRTAMGEVGGQYTDAFRTGQDYDLWLRMSERWDVAVLVDVLYRYRWHEGMASKQRQAEQAANARQALMNAVARRAVLGRSLAKPLERPLAWTSRYSRREWADRFLWWAAGARFVGQGYPAQFARCSLLLNPLNRNWWSFAAGVAGRKLKRATERGAAPAEAPAAE